MKIVFMGTPPAAAECLNRLIADRHEIVAVYTQPDKPSGRGHKVTFSAVKQLALSHGLPILQPLKIRTEEAAATFTSHDADVAIVVAYGRILPNALLEAFPRGAINIHFSLLPKYRGAAPVNWAIVNGERETGVTTIKMDSGLDTGPVLLQRSTPILPDETAPDLMQRLAHFGAEVLRETLARIDSIQPKQQVHELASYAPLMKREDGLIDWSLNAAELVNRVLGFQPFPGSYTSFSDGKLTFWRASVSTAEPSNAAPGTILEARGDALRIACGSSSAIDVHELQPEGKKRMSVRDFLNGFRLVPMTRLGA